MHAAWAAAGCHAQPSSRRGRGRHAAPGPPCAPGLHSPANTRAEHSCAAAQASLWLSRPLSYRHYCPTECTETGACIQLGSALTSWRSSAWPPPAAPPAPPQGSAGGSALQAGGGWARGAVSPELASRSVPPASGTSKLQRRMAGIAARVGCPQQRCQRHSPSSPPMVAPPSRCGWRSFSRSSCSLRAAAGARPGATSCCRHRQACCCELCQLHAINQTAHRCELGLGPAADDGHYLIVAVAAHTQVARHPADTGGGSVSTSGGRRGGGQPGLQRRGAPPPYCTRRPLASMKSRHETLRRAAAAGCGACLSMGGWRAREQTAVVSPAPTRVIESCMWMCVCVFEEGVRVSKAATRDF